MAVRKITPGKVLNLPIIFTLAYLFSLFSTYVWLQYNSPLMPAANAHYLRAERTENEETSPSITVHVYIQTALDF